MAILFFRIIYFVTSANTKHNTITKCYDVQSSIFLFFFFVCLLFRLLAPLGSLQRGRGGDMKPLIPHFRMRLNPKVMRTIIKRTHLSGSRISIRTNATHTRTGSTPSTCTGTLLHSCRFVCEKDNLATYNGIKINILLHGVAIAMAHNT